MNYSVIIPCYNSAATLERALASVHSQTIKPSQVVVVDDGSGRFEADAQREIVERMGGEYIYKDNGGAASARNVGAARSIFPWLAFLDADDEWEPTKIQEQFQRISSDKDVCILTNVAVYTNDKLRFIQRKYIPECKKVLAKRILLGKLTMCTPTILVSKDVYLSVGGFNNTLKLREDHEFLLKVIEKGFGINLIELPLVKRHETDGSLSQSYSGYYFIKHQMGFLKSCVRNRLVETYWVFPFVLTVVISTLKVTGKKIING